MREQVLRLRSRPLQEIEPNKVQFTQLYTEQVYISPRYTINQTFMSDICAIFWSITQKLSSCVLVILWAYCYVRLFASCRLNECVCVDCSLECSRQFLPREVIKANLIQFNQMLWLNPSNLDIKSSSEQEFVGNHHIHRTNLETPARWYNTSVAPSDQHNAPNCYF